MILRMVLNSLVKMRTLRHVKNIARNFSTLSFIGCIVFQSIDYQGLNPFSMEVMIKTTVITIVI
jgi:predicted transcriptional regulator